MRSGSMLRMKDAVLAACLVMAVGVAASPGRADEAAAPPLARMDALWAQRDKGDRLQELVSLGTTAAANDPDNYDVQWRLARAYFWVAFTQSNRVVKKAVAAQAMEWADRARTQQPQRVEGHYLYAISVGAYADTIGIMQAIVDGVAGKVESAAERAYEIDRDYYHGAPGTVLGRYYFLLPWPKRDLERSRHYLEEVTTRHPESLIARYYLADTYVELGERARAREQLTFILANDVAPGTELDQPAPKALARDAMQRWFPDQPVAAGAGE
jgi:hypothetical protein